MTLIFSLLDSPAFGGAEQYLLDHLYTLQKLKQFTVVLATNNQAVKEKVKTDGGALKVINLPYRLDAIGNWKGLLKYFFHAPIALIWFISTLYWFSKKYTKIIVYMPGFSDRMIFSPVVKLFGRTLVWLEFGPLQPLFKRNWGFPKLLYRIGERFPDKVVTISEYTEMCLLHDTHIPPHKVVKVYPTTRLVSDQQLRRLKEQGRGWRTRHGLLQKKLITFVGRLASEKEIDLLLKAFKKTHTEMNNTHLVIVGDGPERKGYERLAKKVKTDRFVLFTGFVSELTKKQILATSNVFVFPSAWELEGFGMTTIEAMMLETPVISSGTGPQAEIVEDEKTGFIFYPHTAGALAQTIIKVLKNSKKSALIATNGRALVSTKFKDLNQLTKLFNNLKS